MATEISPTVPLNEVQVMTLEEFRNLIFLE